MADSVIINGIIYPDVPWVRHPKAQGGGYAVFYDTDDATLDNGNKMLTGVTGYGANGVKYTGSIPSKAAATFTPGTSDQTIPAGQYLAGAQTIKGDQNLQSQYILKDVRIFDVVGSLSVPTVSQDSTTKGLTIQ